MIEDPHDWAKTQQMRRLGFLFRPMTGSWVASAPPGRNEGMVELTPLDGAGVFGGNSEALEHDLHWPAAPYAIDFLNSAGQAVFRTRLATRDALFDLLPESMMSSFGALHDALAKSCGLPAVVEHPQSRVLPEPDAFSRVGAEETAASVKPTVAIVPGQLAMF